MSSLRFRLFYVQVQVIIMIQGRVDRKEGGGQGGGDEQWGGAD